MHVPRVCTGADKTTMFEIQCRNAIERLANASKDWLTALK